ncbi:DUF6188 family protein [Sinosporangium siamense]|uniref:DUF6188 family protein n=1 Tax=Sinosporangium siamense TaxID=1367973 RepID=UPI0035A23F45
MRSRSRFPLNARRWHRPALALFGATIVSPVAFKSGALRLVFDAGTQLNVKFDSQFEAWSTCGPDDLSFVYLPGGGLRFFDDRRSQFGRSRHTTL